MIRLLIWLYPRSFRAEYGEGLERLLRDELTEADRHPRPINWIKKCHALLSFAVHGLMERASSLSPGSAYAWAQDLRLAARSAIRRPVFSLIAITSITIGLAANAVVFSFVDTLFLETIPGVTGADRIVEIGTTSRTRDGLGNWSYPDFLSLREHAPLEHAALFDAGPVSLSHEGAGEQLLGLYTTSGYFESLGVDLHIGRGFTNAEERGTGAHPVVVLAYRTWMDRFDGDAAILGQTVRLNREPHTIVGVAPESFRGHQFGVRPFFYLPITQHRAAREDPDRFFDSRGTSWASVVGRMPEGVEVQELNAALETIFTRLSRELPETNEDRGARAAIATMAPADARPLMFATVVLISALMLLVLAATSANVSGMLLARASAREQELAIRTALGSGQARIIGHLASEAFLVFALGGAGALLIASRVLAFDLNRILPTPIPVDLSVGLDARLVAYVVAVTIGSGFIFGLLPAVQVARQQIATVLRDPGGGAGRRAGRMRRIFVSGQVAVTLLLLITSGLFVRSLILANDLEPGFDPEGVYTTTLDLSLEGYDDAGRANSLIRALVEQVGALPDVQAVVAASDLPLDGGSSSTPVWPDGRAGRDQGFIQSDFSQVSVGYFEMLGIPLVSGRTFADSDAAAAERMAIVNRRLAEEAWPEGDAIGSTVEWGLEPVRYTVIGVVENTRSDMITAKERPAVYAHLQQFPSSEVHIAVRRSGSAEDFVPRVRAAMQRADPALALSPTRSLSMMADIGLLPFRLLSGLAGALGGLALLLSALGLYGVIALAVAQRTREIGVRIALGSARGHVVARILREGLVMAAPGALVGVVLAAMLGRPLSAMLPIDPLDPLTYAGVGLIVLTVVVIACIAPATRAARIQPMEALRFD